MKEPQPPNGCTSQEPSVDLRPIEGAAADAELATMARAIGHPARVQILRLVVRRATCICG